MFFTAFGVGMCPAGAWVGTENGFCREDLPIMGADKALLTSGPVIVSSNKAADNKRKIGESITAQSSQVGGERLRCPSSLDSPLDIILVWILPLE